MKGRSDQLLTREKSSKGVGDMETACFRVITSLLLRERKQVTFIVRNTDPRHSFYVL